MSTFNIEFSVCNFIYHIIREETFEEVKTYTYTKYISEYTHTLTLEYLEHKII